VPAPEQWPAPSSTMVFLIDRAQPACGAAWLDTADLVPHLILAGHTPAHAEQALAAVPAWRDADPDVITSYAIAFAGYWTRMSRQPAAPTRPARQSRP
jgi:hypothetical protein